MAQTNLAPRPRPENPQHDGSTFDSLTELVKQAEKPKPPQPAPVSETDEARKDRNARMLLDLWAQGEKMQIQAKPAHFEDPALDPLTIALNGFPDVNTSYAYYDSQR